MAYAELVEEAKGLSDDSVSEVVDFIKFLKRKEERALSREDNAKRKNMDLLSGIEEMQSEDDEDYVSDIVLENALRIVFHLECQPELFKTFENSIQMQFEAPDGSYLEFEVFEDRITSMLVPERKYDQAFFPEVDLRDMKKINEVVKKFYAVK